MNRKKVMNVYLVFIIVFTFLLALFLGVLLEHFRKESEEISNVHFHSNYDCQVNPYSKEEFHEQTGLGYFKGDCSYNYLSYRIVNGQLVFNGDAKSLKSTPVADNLLECWRNDLVSISFILFRNDATSIRNLEIDVFSEELAPDFCVSFVHPIKAKNKVNGSSIYKGEYYAFDLIDNITILPVMNFEFQPIIFTIKSNNDQKPGIYKYQIQVKYVERNEDKTLNIEQKICVRDKIVPQDESFGFDAMLSPTKSEQYNLKNFAINPISVANENIVWQTWDYIKYGNNQRFLTIENQEKFIDFYRNFNDWAKMSYGYTPNFAINYAKFSLTNKNKKSTKNLDELKNLTYKDFLTCDDLVWEFKFDWLGQYIKMLKAANFKKLYIPITPRGLFVLPFVYQSSCYQIDSKSPNPRLGIKATFIDREGNLTSKAKLFFNTVFLKFLRGLENYLKNQIFDDFDCYFSFDETKSKVNDYLINLVKQNSSIFKFHAYIGWEYNVNLNKKNPDLDFYDDISFQQRLYTFKNSNDGIIKLAKKRKANKKVTRIYSSWHNYPAAFLGSNFSEQYWSEIFAYKLGLNGSGRYALDFMNNDIVKDEEEKNNKKEPGDSYLLYPDSINYFDYSMRMLNYLEGIKAVNKLMFLSRQNNREVSNFLATVIKKADNDVQQSAYKWNLNYFTSMKILNDFIKNNNLKINDQTDVIKNYINLKSKEF